MKINTLYYLKNLITDIHVASITPTSRFGVEKVLEKIDFPETKLILEYGPGTGNFTTTLLKNMGANSKLIAIEKIADFCKVLHKSIRDPRFSVFEDSAENVLDILKSCNGSSDPKADYIISGIPFSLLSPKKRKVILRDTHRALKNGGEISGLPGFLPVSRGPEGSPGRTVRRRPGSVLHVFPPSDSHPGSDQKGLSREDSLRRFGRAQSLSGKLSGSGHDSIVERKKAGKPELLLRGKHARSLHHPGWRKRNPGRKGKGQGLAQNPLVAAALGPRDLPLLRTKILPRPADHGPYRPPRSGGKTTRGNVAPACKECNSKKKYLLPMEWEEYLKGFDRKE